MLETVASEPREQAASGHEAPVPSQGWRGWLAQTLPTVLILLLLGGLAALGHATGWKVPKFSSLLGTAPEGNEDWCPPHSVPESLCVECKPELLPRGKVFGWCKKHGVHECPLCHPEVAQLTKTPSVSPADLERAQRALDFTPRPENSNLCKLQARRLQFASEEAVTKAGIEIEPAARGPMIEFVPANGEITYDQTRVARLSSRVPGTVWLVQKQVGDRVQRGEVVALVDAAEVGRVKAEFLQAFALVDVKTRILANMRTAETVIPARTVQEVEAALREARIRLVSAQQALTNLGLPIQTDGLQSLTEEKLALRLQFLGLPENLVRTFDPKTTTGNLLPIVAPLDGIVVAREVVAGEVVDQTKVLLMVADTRQLWLTLDVRLEDARLLALGQRVVFRPEGGKDEVTAKINWISTAVDHKTRTVKVRADLANAEGRLRASTFGTGRVILREEPNAVVVAKEALNWEGCCHVVFVRDKNYLKEGSPKVFHVRKVVPGAKDDKSVEIIAGLLPGEIVATKGSGVLRSELLKNNLGDG